MLKQNSQRRSILEFCLSIAGLTTGKRVLLKRNWLLASVAVCTAEVWIRVLPLILCLSDFVPLMKIVPATRQGVTVLTFNPHTWLLHAVVLVELGYVPASLLLLCLPLDRRSSMHALLSTRARCAAASATAPASRRPTPSPPPAPDRNLHGVFSWSQPI